MSGAGLQIWDGNSNLVFDTTSYAASVLGTFQTNGSQSGTWSDAALGNGGSPFYIVTSVGSSPDLEFVMFTPQVSFTSSGVNWSFLASYNGSYPSCQIIYGVV